MEANQKTELSDIIGDFPYRLALAGGWIDQPFCSKLNPTPPGSMCVVGIEPNFYWMERAGLATGTRKFALKLWGQLPGGDPAQRVEELYNAENEGRDEPSGSQDMIGLLYPGVSRLDYDYEFRGGVFPRHIENNTDTDIARWLESVINVLPVAPRPPGYSPLGIKNLENVELISRLGKAGQDCYDAILAKNINGLGAAMTETMQCWETLVPHSFTHSTITMDLLSLLKYYQSIYPGACYSGCGGGYLYVVSEEPLPGTHRIKVRTS